MYTCTHTHTKWNTAAIKQKEVLLFATLMGHEGIMWNERRQKTNTVRSYVWNLKKLNAQKRRVEWWCPGAGGDADQRGQTSSYKLVLGSHVQHGDELTLCHILKVATRVNLKCSHHTDTNTQEANP